MSHSSVALKGGAFWPQKGKISFKDVAGDRWIGGLEGYIHFAPCLFTIGGIGQVAYLLVILRRELSGTVCSLDAHKHADLVTRRDTLGRNGHGEADTPPGLKPY